MIGVRRGQHWHTASARGPRANNADAVGAYAVKGGPGLAFALADGVGDSPAAARAARTAAATAARANIADGPVAAILAAQRAVHALGGDGDAVLVVAMPAATGYRIAWVGDVRAYAWDGVLLSQLTTDHTLAQYFRARHQPTTPRMEHMVTTSVRTTHPHEIGTAELTGSGGLLLSSDGVHKTVPLATMQHILADPAGSAQGLVDRAMALGGTDNATALFVEPLADAVTGRIETGDAVTARFPLAA
ncbi:PP2C family protein-serine/threonine phosphatase [Amycolatopsis sp. NPDC059021]|uniref:PP2C family protein-serine/threonine phosphatase n=1 Tax=Amycolatopsis sp. NPDC059021 TaxID=3346704 RepID=UPI00366C9F55